MSVPDPRLRLSDDCNDNSDESAGCDLFTSTSFEDPNPEDALGFFSQEGGAGAGDFRWERGNGSANSRGTGPPFDHTLFSPAGHYLYIPSLLGLPGDAARLLSPAVTAGPGCALRDPATTCVVSGLASVTVFVSSLPRMLKPGPTDGSRTCTGAVRAT